jgi:hypothetical protein
MAAGFFSLVGVANQFTIFVVLMDIAARPSEDFYNLGRLTYRRIVAPHNDSLATAFHRRVLLAVDDIAGIGNAPRRTFKALFG